MSADSSEGQRVRGMASGNRPAHIPPIAMLPSWEEPVPSDEDFIPDTDFDIDDLTGINKAHRDVIGRIYRESQHLSQYQKRYQDACFNYDRAYRRLLVQQQGGSAETRRAMAELWCEEFENERAVARQLVEDCKRRTLDCREELRALMSLSNNIRAQIKIV